MLLGIIHSISQYLFFITSTGEVKLLNNCVQDIIQTSLDRLHSTHSRYQFYMGSVARSDDPGFNESIQTLGRILSKRDLRSTARWGMELNTWDRPNGVAYILRATLRGATGCCSALRLATEIHACRLVLGLLLLSRRDICGLICGFRCSHLSWWSHRSLLLLGPRSRCNLLSCRSWVVTTTEADGRGTTRRRIKLHTRN